MSFWFASLGGALLIALVLIDVYLTVLYARSGVAILSHRLGRWTWRAFCLLSRPIPRASDSILSFAGPTLLVVLATAWVGGLLAGFALVVWPALGGGVVAAEGPTPRDFASATYVSGYYMTTVGNGDFRPVTAFYKLVLVLDSIVGISVITLMLTYFVQIYNALQARSTFALKLHKASAATGDAAEVVAALGAAGNFEGARGLLMVIADELFGVYESYHFYEALIHFRFGEPLYGLPRAAFVMMDAVTLTRTALDREKYAFLTRSAAVVKLWHGGKHALTELSRVFVPTHRGDRRAVPPDARAAERWKRRYVAAIARLRAEGIETAADERAGAEAYVSMRSEWDGLIRGFAAYLLYSMEQIDLVDDAAS